MQGQMPNLAGSQAAHQAGRKAWRLAAWGLAFVVGYIGFAVKPYTELPLYMRAGERMRDGEPIYRTDERPYTYPPLFALPFVPMTWLSEPFRRPMWYVVNFAALAVIVLRLERRVAPILRSGPPAWAFWGLVALLAGRHILAVLENQSHDLLVLLCAFLAIDCLCSARSKLSGLLAGLGAALKATPLLFAPLFLWQRRFAALACLVLALGIGSFVPDLLCPAKDGVGWNISWYRTFLHLAQPGESASSTAWAAWNQLNQSLAGTCHRLFAPPPDEPDRYDVSFVTLDRNTLKVVTLTCQLAAFAWLMWVTRPALTRHLSGEQLSFARLGEGAALLTAMVLLSPTSIKTHFCVLLVPIAYCLADYLYRRRDLLVGGALAIAFVLGTLTVKGLVSKQLGDRIMAYGTVTGCAVALYAATGRVLLQRSKCALQDLSVLGSPAVFPASCEATHPPACSREHQPEKNVA
jgi:hypothetical protein